MIQKVPTTKFFFIDKWEFPLIKFQILVAIRIMLRSYMRMVPPRNSEGPNSEYKNIFCSKKLKSACKNKSNSALKIAVFTWQMVIFQKSAQLVQNTKIYLPFKIKRNLQEQIFLQNQIFTSCNVYFIDIIALTMQTRFV